MEIDFTSTKLADLLMVPHDVIVKKVRKYAGYNQKTVGGQPSGKIYKENNRLRIVKYAKTEDKQTIYGFNKAEYDSMTSQEARFQEASRKKAVKTGKKNYAGSALEAHQTGLKKKK